jgi:phenylpropionate dioxygenase-like ring-hydroxylating dioxygenase large terminal subunit
MNHAPDYSWRLVQDAQRRRSLGATSLTDIGRRLLANVHAKQSDFAESMMLVPAEEYRNPERFRCEIHALFQHQPLLVALTCDVPEPGDFTTMDIADRPIVVVRGEDGVARTFLNACRHRGRSVVDECFGHSRRLTCPYHSWAYDTEGTLVGIPGSEAFEGIEADGLIEYPTAEISGAVFAVLTVGARLDIDEWLGDMGPALAMLKLDELHRHDVETKLPSGNWKATADGYLDGYHLGYLHGASIGAKSITNRNTYDLYGPHVRIGFANKPILDVANTPPEEWHDLYAAFSLVHYVFPNISISGHPDRSLMVSRLFPGPTVDHCTVVQYQYFREPLATKEQRAEAEAKRKTYEQVTYDEDFVTVMNITRRLDVLADAGEHIRFGRNEVGNQNLHTWVAKLLDSA